MITTVSLNPSIDRTLSVDGFHYGGMNRVLCSRDDACGKAVNLAIVASRLGAETRCVGFLARRGGAPLTKRLKKEGVAFEFVPVPGRVRVNIKLLDEQKHVITEINERGQAVDARHLEALTRLVEDYARRSAYMVLTGSIPPGCPAAYYETLGLIGSKQRCFVALDADGEALRMGLKAKPFLIKPNRDELEKLVGSSLPTLQDVRRAARELQRGGVEMVCVTLGAEGALMVCGEWELLAEPLELRVRSTVGAGDSMLGAMIAGLSRDEPLERAFRMGVAAASASVVSEGTELINADTYQGLLDKIRIQRL